MTHRRLAGLALGLALLAFGACTPTEPSVQPYFLSVEVVGSPTVALDRLRLTSVLEGDDDLIVIGPDVAVTATGTPVALELRHAPELVAEQGRSALRLTIDGQGLGVMRPRLVAYLDHDANGRFQDGASRFGPDQILGVEEFWRGVAWLPEPEDQVGVLSPEAAAAFYEATEDRLTPFVPVRLQNSGELSVDDSGDPVLVDIGRLSIAKADLSCRRQLRSDVDPPPAVTLWVDRALDAERVCGLEIADCRPVDTSTLTAPALPEHGPSHNPAVETIAQCRRRAGLELLVIEERRVRCAPRTCLCQNLVQVVAVATSTSAPSPDWWPCGDTVDYCPSARALYRTDPACIPDEEEDDDE